MRDFFIIVCPLIIIIWTISSIGVFIDGGAVPLPLFLSAAAGNVFLALAVLRYLNSDKMEN